VAILVSSIDEEEEAECEWVNRVFTEVLWVGNDYVVLRVFTGRTYRNVYISMYFQLGSDSLASREHSTTNLRFSNFVYLNYLAYITMEYIVSIIKITDLN